MPIGKQLNETLQNVKIVVGEIYVKSTFYLPRQYAPGHSNRVELIEEKASIYKALRSF